MARLPQTGSAVASLYERTPEIEQLIEHGARLRETAQKLREAGHPHVPEHLHIPEVAPLEYLTTLAAVISDLRLAPLSQDDENIIRDNLGAVVGRGLQEFQRSPNRFEIYCGEKRDKANGLDQSMDR